MGMGSYLLQLSHRVCCLHTLGLGGFRLAHSFLEVCPQLADGPIGRFKLGIAVLDLILCPSQVNFELSDVPCLLLPRLFGLLCYLAGPLVCFFDKGLGLLDFSPTLFKIVAQLNQRVLLLLNLGCERLCFTLRSSGCLLGFIQCSRSLRSINRWHCATV